MQFVGCLLTDAGQKTLAVLDQIAVLVLVALDTLAVNVSLIESEVRIRSDAVKMTSVIFGLERSLAADAQRPFVAFSYIRVEDYLQLLEMLLSGLDPFAHLLDLEAVVFRLESLRVKQDTAHRRTGHLQCADCRRERLLADLAALALGLVHYISPLLY